MNKAFLTFIFCLAFSFPCLADVQVGAKKLILPNGDSLTEGTGDSVGNLMGYRDHLQTEIGTTLWELVGTEVKPISATGFKTNHNGFPSGSTAQTEESTLFALTKYFTANAPEGSLVILWAGTNDAARTNSGVAGYSVAGAVANIEDTLDVIRTFNSDIRVLVVNLGPNGTAGVDTQMTSFNTQLVTMLQAYQVSYPTFDVDLVDMKSMINNDSFGLCGGAGNFRTNCYNDTTHFNDLGYRAVAKQIAACINNPNTTNCDGTP